MTTTSNGTKRADVGILALGLVTITAYGSWFYAFGVLVEPIAADTGWRTSALGAAYGLAQILAGFGAFIGGRMLDRFDARAPFGLQAVVGGGLLVVASLAQDLVLFVVVYALAGGVIGGTGFYHVTTAAAARLRPDQPDRAIARLTVLGALASPIYLPATAWLVQQTDWRTTMQILAVVTTLGAIFAAVAATGASSQSDKATANPFQAMREAGVDPAVRRMLVVYLLAGLSFAAVLVYQVPVMTGAGVPLALAGLIGGLRGLFQIFGRVGLIGMVERFGVRALLRGAYAATAVGIGLLGFGTVGAGVGYAVVAGVAIGASTPLQAMYGREVFDEADLGLLMGLQGAALGIAGGAGAFAGGALFDLTGSWTPVVLISVAGAVAAAALLTGPATAPTTPPTSADSATAR